MVRNYQLVAEKATVLDESVGRYFGQVRELMRLVLADVLQS